MCGLLSNFDLRGVCRPLARIPFNQLYMSVRPRARKGLSGDFTCFRVKLQSEDNSVLVAFDGMSPSQSGKPDESANFEYYVLSSVSLQTLEGKEPNELLLEPRVFAIQTCVCAFYSITLVDLVLRWSKVWLYSNTRGIPYL